jgi:hypothetical protein
MTGGLTNLTVQLDISGGFTGDLYADLVSSTGGSVMLLNRVGMVSSNLYGYRDAGFNITFDADSAKVYSCQAAGSYPSLLVDGQSTLVSWG